MPREPLILPPAVCDRRGALDAAHHAGRTRIIHHLTPERTAA